MKQFCEFSLYGFNEARNQKAENCSSEQPRWVGGKSFHLAN